jgi:flagella basal body P-ring formation protein FlgA
MINRSLLMYKVNPYIGNDDDILLKAPNRILVHRTSQLISSARLEEMFTNHIFKSSPWPREKLKIEKINNPGPIALPVGDIQWDIQENHNRNYLGNVALTINFRVDEKSFRKISVSGRISINQEVVKTVKRIERGRLISEDDLILVTENSYKYRKDAVSNIAEAIGKISTRSIQADQIILSGMIEVPPMVQKGNQVIIKVENEEIRITATGKVLEDGRSGDRVRVMNVNSGKEILAVVKGPDLVEIYF